MAFDPNAGLPPELAGAPDPGLPPDPGADAGGGGGLPPELMALLQGGGGDAATQDPQGGGGGDSPVALIQQMIDAAKAYLEVEPDEEDKLTMTKVLQQLQQYLAKDQSEGEDMLAGKISPRAMRRSSAGG